MLICQSALNGKLLRRFDSGKSNSLIAHLVLDEDEALIERYVLDGHRLDSAHLVRINSTLAHEDVVNHIDAVLVGDIVIGLHESGAHGEALLHGLHIEVVTGLDESRLVRNSSVGNISAVVFPVNKVLSPTLPLLLASDGGSNEGSVASGGIGKAGTLLTSKREVRLEESRLVRNSRVSGISAVVFPIDEVLGPFLPLLLASDGGSSEGLVTCGGIREARALSASKIELSLNKSGSVRDSGVSSIGLLIFPVNEVLGPSLPFLLAFDSASSEGLVTSRGIGEAGTLHTGEVELSSNESGSIRDSGVGSISAVVFPVDKVLSPSLPFLLTSRLLQRCVTVGGTGKARATLLASKIELSKSGGIRKSGVGNFGALIFPVDEVLSPSLPFLLASRDRQRCVTGGSSRKTRALLASKVKLRQTVSLLVQLDGKKATALAGILQFDRLVELIAPLHALGKLLDLTVTVLVLSLHNRNGLTLEEVGILGKLIVLLVQSLELIIEPVKSLMHLVVRDITL